MLKKLTPRERVIVTLLPAGFLLMGYFFFYARPANKQVAELQRQYEVLRERAPSQAALAALHGERVTLRRQLNERKGKQSDDDSSGLWNDPAVRARANEFLARAIVASGLVLIEERLTNDKPGELPAFEALKETPVWEIALVGSYAGMESLLRKLGESDLPLVPLGLEMDRQAGEGETILHWKLWMHR